MRILFWYCFTFTGHDKQGHDNATGSTYTGLVSKKVTYDDIVKAKESAGMSKDCVQIGLMYLGRMTKARFVGDAGE